MKKSLKVWLHILSPVHIGCDDVYDPTNFVIDTEQRKLIEFDPIDFIKSLNEKERSEFQRLTSVDNLLQIFKFIKKKYKPQIKGKIVDIAQGLSEHYINSIINQGTYDKKVIFNQFIINKTLYNPNTNKPYISGSSLKGALRTAYISMLAKNNDIHKYWLSDDEINNLENENNLVEIYKKIGKKKISNKLENKLLNIKNNDFSTDPFRNVKISDFLPLHDVSTKIVYAVNKKKKNSNKPAMAENSSIYQIFEIIKENSVFEGFIDFHSSLTNQHEINDENLLKSTLNFYSNNLSGEIKSIHNLSENCKHQAGILANQKFKEKKGKSAFLIRIGRHSGAEAVTIDNNRLIKIMIGNRQTTYLDHSTTYWLSSEYPRPQTNDRLIPFGWAILEIKN